MNRETAEYFLIDLDIASRSLKNKTFKNGFIGMCDGFYDYCNEKEKNKATFVLKCTPNCKHNAPDQSKN